MSCSAHTNGTKLIQSFDKSLGNPSSNVKLWHTAEKTC